MSFACPKCFYSRTGQPFMLSIVVLQSVLRVRFVYVKCYYKVICPDRQGGNLLYVYYYNSISYLVRCEKNN